MHIELSEGQRFISRYNALAAEVGGMIGDELARDDEEDPSKHEDHERHDQEKQATNGKTNQNEGKEHATTSSDNALIDQPQDGGAGQDPNEEEVESYETAVPFDSLNAQSLDPQDQVQEEEGTATAADATDAGDETFITTADGDQAQGEEGEVENAGEGNGGEEHQNEESFNQEEFEDQNEEGQEQYEEEGEGGVEYTEEGQVFENGNQEEYGEGDEENAEAYHQEEVGEFEEGQVAGGEFLTF